MIRLLAAILTLSFAALCSADEKTWHADIDVALDQAKKENKPVLLFFTGSDWCEPCQNFKEQVLDQAPFLSIATRSFVLAEIDFPEKTVLPAKIADQNGRLAELYHIEGYPTIVLISAEGRPFWVEMGAVNENPAHYAQELISKHRGFDQFVALVKQSKELPPPLAAERLAKALETLPDELVPRHYRPELERLTELDPKDDTGYRKRLQFADERAKINAQMTQLFLDGNYGVLVKLVEDVIEKRADIFSKSDLQMLHLRCAMANLHLKDFDAAIKEIDEIEKIDPESHIGKHVDSYRERIKHQRMAFHQNLKAAGEADSE